MRLSRKRTILERKQGGGRNDALVVTLARISLVNV
jgi:hypothetical protein